MPMKITQYPQKTPENVSYHFSPDNKIQLLLRAVSSSTLTPQMPRTFNYTEKFKQYNWGDIPITGEYSLLFQKLLFQPKFGAEFENHEEESELESKETSEKTSTRPVTETSNQSRNQETYDQEEEITHTKHLKDPTRNSAAAKIIACYIRTSEQNTNQYTPIPRQYLTTYQNQGTYQQ
ncbi:hypothetical protein G9A89_018350 [Geosiphon pyriformis]|nr:hypothetical protein G9A89_018350 [Geosiphon pyriformis]